MLAAIVCASAVAVIERNDAVTTRRTKAIPPIAGYRSHVPGVRSKRRVVDGLPSHAVESLRMQDTLAAFLRGLRRRHAGAERPRGRRVPDRLDPTPGRDRLVVRHAAGARPARSQAADRGRPPVAAHAARALPGGRRFAATQPDDRDRRPREAARPGRLDGAPPGRVEWRELAPDVRVSFRIAARQVAHSARCDMRNVVGVDAVARSWQF